MRRLLSVPAVVLLAVVLVVMLPVWLLIALLIDLVRAPRRLPHTRLMCFALWWAWLETCGLVVAGWLFLTGRSRRYEPHFALQRWWVNGLVAGVRRTCGLVLEPRSVDVLAPGPVVVLPRHASLADALLSAWFVTRVGLRPRYVLKRELLADPCLDIVGNRLPNHFLDREAADRACEINALAALASGVTGAQDAIVIFPEGTRANPAKRARALARLAERDPKRAARLGGLRHLNPPRPGGTLTVLDAAPRADVVLMWHAGLEGLDSFSGILRAIPGDAPVIVDCLRIPRAEVPGRDVDMTDWLDAQWLALDDRVDALLTERARLSATGRDPRTEMDCP
jgi:1-acyl-sn-glycerol-3-phosphate acyltransferase